MPDMRIGLARLSVNDSRCLDSEFQDLINFCLGSTIESVSQCSQKTKNFWIRITLDSWGKETESAEKCDRDPKKLTIMRFDSWKI